MTLKTSLGRTLRKIIYGSNYVDSGEFVEFTNDYMFCTVMENEEYCREFLERVLGIKITELRYAVNQKSIRNRVEARGVRLDVYVRDTENNAYDIEMQTTKEKHLAKRIRYYHSEMDGYQIKKGVGYNKLGKNIVIFICTYDPIGDNRSIYTYKKYCAENKQLELEDGEISIILNSEGSRKDIDNSLACFLDYIKTGESTDDFTKRLSEKVKEINSDEDWRDRHMTLKMKMDERYEAGIEQGIEQGIEALILDNLEEGKSENQIINKLIKRFHLTNEKAKELFDKYSKNGRILEEKI